jgi:hypothetical protein
MYSTGLATFLHVRITARPIERLINLLFNRPQGEKYVMQPREVVSGNGVAGICCPLHPGNISKPTNPPIRLRQCGTRRVTFSEFSYQIKPSIPIRADRRLSSRYVEFHLRRMKFAFLCLSLPFSGLFRRS